MHKRRAAALTAALLLLGAPACALEAGGMQAYGGSGEDALYEAVACGDGLFAVGTTASSDYDLSMRTRSGETGWALRLDADGNVQFCFCTGRAGMARMTAPAALEDGACSLVLTDEMAQRGEWIVLDERGKSVSRVTVDGAAALCPQAVSIERMLPVQTDKGILLAALVRHADGETMCCAHLSQDGSVTPGEAFDGGESGAACAGRSGLLAYAAVQDGVLSLVFVSPQGTPERCAHESLESGVQAVFDAQMGSDGSVAVCGGKTDGGGFLLRVSREGEQLFLLETDAPLTCLTATETGYAALEQGRILFTDEDGTGAAWAPAPEGVLDLASSPGGAAALSHEQARGRRQAVLTHVAQPVLEQMQAQIEDKAPSDTIAAGDGILLCSAEDALGVRVRHVAADGRELFSVRTPIHTAADALEWRCAAKLDDGSILLGGQYLYGTGEGAYQEGVTALLGGDGVLRRMETLEGAAAVLRIEITPEGGILLHTQDQDLEDAVQVYAR